MKQMKTLTIGPNTYEVVDETARGRTYEDVGAAPADFGLGTEAKWITVEGTDLNDVNANGWYVFNSTDNANSPFETGTLFVVARDKGAFAYQIAFEDSGHSLNIKVRKMTGGSWSDWIDWTPTSFAPAGFITKLWENASPSSAFSPQTVSVNYAGYDYLYILAITSNAAKETGNYMPCTKIPAIVGASGNLCSFSIGTEGLWGHSRTATLVDGGVQFSNGNMINLTEANHHYLDWASRAIPVAIYGIKGVQ